MKSETLSVLAVFALFCIIAVFGWALVSLAYTVRDAVRRVINKEKERENG
jgi:hypothetical protein